MWICSRAVTNRHKAGQGPHLLGIAHRARSIPVYPDGLCSIVSLKKNILVVLRVHASISTKLTWKRLGRRMDVPALPQPCLAMPICPRTALGTSCSAVPGVLAWGLLSLLQLFCQPARELADGPVPWPECQGQNEIHQLDIHLPNEWRVVSYLARHQLVFFAHPLMNSAKGKNTLIMN